MDAVSISSQSTSGQTKAELSNCPAKLPVDRVGLKEKNSRRHEGMLSNSGGDSASDFVQHCSRDFPRSSSGRRVEIHGDETGTDRYAVFM
ncbi:hypothetical protein Y032_0032g2585 [Ancylostoma ceylanicum]|uniref:Uncharacterized protein n=1 Tax=Ancylostoma ceylanicum TaxID=53326 RepID=A0A016UPU6_9BILA|nr:hypothetical protein Y032_0032g2585 [Ancylostoma ceylanicum]